MNKTMWLVLVVAIIVVFIMSGSVDFVANNYGTIMFALVGVLFALFLASIIVCLIMRIVPLYYDIAVVLTMIGLAINFAFDYYGIAHIYAMMASVPLYAIAALCISTVFDEFISIDELFDWICDDKYDEYYKELCEREKAKNAKQELSVHKQAKQKKIENKPAVRQEKKQKKELNSKNL